MPAISGGYIDPNHTSRNNILENKDERKIRTKEYEKVLEYYEGRQKESLTTPEGEPNDNMVINLINQVIERTRSFLFAKSPTYESTPSETEETDEEVWARDFIDFNGGLAFLQEIAEVGSMSGHNYIRLYSLREGENYPRADVLTPDKIITYWAENDPDTVVFHEIKLPSVDGKTTTILDVVFIDGARWEIIEYTNTPGSRWVKTGNVDIWDDKFGPIVHWKHLPNPGKFYGRPEITPANVAMQDQINIQFSLMNRINRFYASPRTVAIGVKAQEIQPTAVNHMWAIENPDAKVINLEMLSQLQAAREIALFSYDAFLSEKRTVILRGGVSDFQRVTNTGVKTIYLDQTAKNEILREQYGRGLSNLIFRATGLGLDRNIVMETIFIDPLPIDRTEAINVHAIERNLGTVSRETVATEQGRAWSSELDKMRQEAKEEIFSMPDTSEGSKLTAEDSTTESG